MSQYPLMLCNEISQHSRTFTETPRVCKHTLTTVRIPSLVSGSVWMAKWPPSSPCMEYLTLHAAVGRVSASAVCILRGDVPFVLSTTLAEP